MLLADHVDSSINGISPHPYIYARVLGIFHVNATYIGPGTVDYRSRRIDFLWVRWYQYLEEGAGWDASMLDRVCFPPMADEHAFGFVDPDDVLQGCHIIPQFLHGLRHPDGTGMSRCVDDSSDWHFYYINRFVIYFSTLLILIISSFVDRDMVMRYHWGLGVGHAHAHSQGPSKGSPQNQEDCYSFPDASEESSRDKDEEDSDLGPINDWDGSDSGSFDSMGSDVDDDILDYQK